MCVATVRSLGFLFSDIDHVKLESESEEIQSLGSL